MREFNDIHAETVNAAGAISANRFVTYGDIQATVLGEKVLGVSRYDAAIGDDLAVTVIGTPAIETGGAFARGVDITTDAAGRAVELTDPLTQTKIGEALAASTGPGLFPRILLAR